MNRMIVAILLTATVTGCNTKGDTDKMGDVPPAQTPLSRSDSVGDAQDSNSLNIEGHTYDNAPFYITSIGPKSLNPHKPEYLIDSKGTHYFSSGDGDGFSRFFEIGSWDVQYDFGLEPVETQDEISSWNTEKGFGIGDYYVDVTTKIGHPTVWANVAEYGVGIYIWKYESDFRTGENPASYQLTVIYEDNYVVGLSVSISEMP